jgi:uncharacterized iron-regulated membrane protein
MKKFLKKIHLWLSVPFGIIITLICLSGASLVFENEITELCNHDKYYVQQVGNKAINLDSLLTQISTTLPDSVEITGVTISNNPERTYQVSLSKPNRASIFVDQYTGEVTGQYERMGFFATMFKLHRWLLDAPAGRESGSAGKTIVGIATLLLVVIVLTGLVLWLMHPKKRVKISVRNGMPRFWHDLHVSGGVYATIFLLALALTGLTWSFSWYRTGFYNLCGVEASAGNHGSHAGNGNRGGNSEGRGSHGEHHGSHGEHHGEGYHGDKRGHGRHEGKPADVSAELETIAVADSVAEDAAPMLAPFANWQQAADNVVAANPDYRQISVTDGSVALIPAGRRSLRASDDYTFDAATGAVTSITTYDSKEKADRLRGTIYNIHTGNWGGLLTRILTMLAALLGATLPITGYYLWAKHLRRKK